MEEHRLLSRCQRVLNELLGRESSLIFLGSGAGPSEPDYQYILELPDEETVKVAVDVKRNLRQSFIPLLRSRVGRWRAQDDTLRYLLFSDYISEAMADALREEGIWFTDEAGNGFLQIDKRLLVYVVGQKPRRVAQLKGEHYSSHGARVLLYLLTHGPEIKATYRDISAATEVSLGKVSRVMNELLDDVSIVRQGRGHYEVRNSSRLLEMWANAFVEKLQPAIVLGRHTSPFGKDFERMLTDSGGSDALRSVVIGGEFAADLLTGHMRAATLNLYVPLEEELAVRQHLKLAPVFGGEVIIHRLFAPNPGKPFERFHFSVASPVVVYAELLADDDPRCGETAQILKERWLRWIP